MEVAGEGENAISTEAQKEETREVIRRAKVGTINQSIN